MTKQLSFESSVKHQPQGLCISATKFLYPSILKGQKGLPNAPQSVGISFLWLLSRVCSRKIYTWMHMVLSGNRLPQNPTIYWFIGLSMNYQVPLFCPFWGHSPFSDTVILSVKPYLHLSCICIAPFTLQEFDHLVVGTRIQPSTTTASTTTAATAARCSNLQQRMQFHGIIYYITIISTCTKTI